MPPLNEGSPGATAPAVTNEILLRAIFGERWRAAHVTAFAGDPKEGTWRGGRVETRPYVLEWADINTFYVVSLFTGSSRSIGAFAGLHVVILDDVGVKANSKAVLAKLGAPSYRIETSPGNQQWGYILEAPELDLGRAEALLNEVARQGLTDPGAKDVARYCRLPVGTNRKPAYGPGGFRHVLREWAPARRFTPDGLMQALGSVLPPPGTARAARSQKPLDRGHAEQDPVWAAMAELGIVDEATSNDWGYQCVCPWVAGHTQRDETGCAYRPGGVGQRGMWKCHHGSCDGRSWHSFVEGLDRQLRDAGLPTMIERDFRDADKATLDALWACLASDRRPTAALYDELALVSEVDVERTLRPALPIFGTNLAPIRGGLTRARDRVMRRFTASLGRAAEPVALPGGYQVPVSLEATRAAMEAALDAFIAAGRGATTAQPSRRSQDHGQ